MAGEPTGLVELRVVGGPGAGLVRRMGLGDYTVGGETADISLPGLEEPLVRVRVKTGPEVSVEPIEQAQKAEAPIRPVRNRKLPGPLVLRIRAGETAKSTSQQETRQQRRRRKKLDRHRRKENKRRLKRGEQPFKQAQPHVEQDPDARRRLIELDRRPIEGSLPWEAEVILGVGQSQLTVGPVPAADAVVVQGSETFTLDFNRPPRLARPQRHAKFTLPRQPQPARKPPFSLIMLVGPLVMGVGMYLLTQRLASLMFTALSPLMMLGNFFTMRSQSNRTHRDEVIKYEEMKQDVEAKAFEALLEEHQLRRGDYPDPAEVMLRATGPRAALWERRYENPDWLVLRVGTADQRSEVELTLPDRAAHEEPYRWTAPDVPVTLSMQQLGVVGVYGPLRRQIAAWMVSQCAVLHSPAELELSILLDPKCSGAAESDWSWSCWLPHIRMPEGKGARLRVATEDTTVSKQVNALLTIIEERQEKKSRRPKTPTIFVVLEGARALRHAPGMIQALREGPGAGVVFLCLDDDRVALPEECRAVLQAEEPLANLSITDEDSIEQVTLDVPIDGWFEQVARSLAPYRDAATKGAEGTIPRSSRFLDIINMPEPSAEEVLKRWTTGTQTTVAVIGEDSEGLFQVDVRADGPHALVAGTTGSGKSELLQTLIASLCIENTPEHMTFVLVDYKGGAAFKDCALLPHTVGMVTDLDGHLTSRALDSLGAELRRREHMLANADAKDIEDYTAAMQPGDEPMPRLMLVIDEFAALVSELPDFVTGLVDIARRGRSLGVHLVLATQRPAGVVSAEIKSNTNLRIALRVTDESDSQDVVESNASAYIPPSIPGRAHARLGHGRLLQFQAARVGGRPHGAVRTSEPQIEDLNLRDLSWPAPVGPVIEEDISIPTDLSALVNAMLEARSEQGLPAPHRPWLEPLPGTLVLDDLQIAYGEPSPAAEQKDQTSFSEGFLPPVVIGLEDLPALQEQRLMTWDYTHTAHLGVAGAPRSGRSTVLRLIAVEIARSASPADVHLYGIDGGSGALLPLVAFPHFGAVILRDQTDRLRRLITKLGTEIARRQQLLALEGYSSISEQRAAVAPGEKLPYIVILLDQWDGIVAVYQQVDGGDLLEKLENLMREGSAVGLRFVLTGDRLVFRGRMGTLLEDRLLLRMPTPEDFDLVGLRSRDVPLEMVPGRGFRTGVKPREVQIALLDQDHAGTAQVAAIQKESQSAQQRWGTIPKELQPPRVDELPLVIDADKAMKMVSTPIVGMVPLGVGGDSLDLLSVSMEEIGNGLLVTGPRRSGKSNSLTFILNYLLQAGVRTLLVLPRRSPLHAWTGKPGVLGVLDSSGTKADVEQILGPEDSDVVVIIDDFEVLGNDHVLADALWGHLKACRDNTGGVLMACGIDDLQAGYRGLLADIRKTRTGLILAPRSAGDGDSFSARLPRSVGAPVPLGRGLMITSQGWSWVQVPRQEHP
ncbi:FtsK/SpoIIIE domain-containing protein [Actinomyces bovis]|uniref:FtsK/SpoIIIE domain-containing protein n=1 Tax=Actinomyces bovis TaxID=1658 RepID=UPI001E5DDBBC|nr:FtsK/SpoIIIE domain-containing protein [Actinomyces bovis]